MRVTACRGLGCLLCRASARRTHAWSVVDGKGAGAQLLAMQLSRGVQHRSSYLTSELMPLLSVACTAARRLCLASSSLGHCADTCTASHQPRRRPVSVQLQAREIVTVQACGLLEHSDNGAVRQQAVGSS